MTKAIFVGEIYNLGLEVGGGPVPPAPGVPTHPIYNPPPGIWGGAPPYVDIGGPGSQPRPSHPIAPGGRPPGYWGGVAPPYPDHGLPGQPPGIWGGPPNYVDIGLPTPPPQPWVPPEGETIPPPPEDIVSKVVVAVWNPTAQAWKVTVGG